MERKRKLTIVIATTVLVVLGATVIYSHNHA